MTHPVIEQLSQQAREPAWVTDLRGAALRRHAELPWPNSSDEIWRRTDLAPHKREPKLSVNGHAPLMAVKADDADVRRLTHKLANEHLFSRADGEWLLRDTPPGVTLMDLADAARERERVVRPILEADGLTPPEQKLASLNTAYHHDGIFLHVEPDTSVAEPIRLARLLSSEPDGALFPSTVIVIGSGSHVTLIHEDIGSARGPQGAPHTINGRIELVLEPDANVTYCRIQRWEPGAQEFLLQRANVARGAQLNMVNINIGGRVTKTHVIAKLNGEGASSRVYGFVFGHDEQHVDFHSLQDHVAPKAFSDLLYKAALKDQSRMIYTGLIRIGKDGKQTNAYQANHNLLLSNQARAESVPMLEILADDVQCKHGATVGPVDEEQLFYLMARAIPRRAAERLLVMGFVDPIIQQVPGEAFQQGLRDEIEAGLGRDAG